jgi:hypothetical protein
VSELFERIPGAVVIIRKKGFHHQVPLYRRSGGAYALTKQGFVRLRETYQTSVEGITWSEIVGSRWNIDRLGWVKL